jgi:hypothetical protein
VREREFTHACWQVSLKRSFESLGSLVLGAFNESDCRVKVFYISVVQNTVGVHYIGSTILLKTVGPVDLKCHDK